MGLRGDDRLGTRHWEEFVIWLKTTPYKPPPIRPFPGELWQKGTLCAAVWATGSMTKMKGGAGRLDLGDSWLGGDRIMVEGHHVGGRFRCVLLRPLLRMRDKWQQLGRISQAPPRMEGGTLLQLGNFPGHCNLCLPSRKFLNSTRSFPKWLEDFQKDE